MEILAVFVPSDGGESFRTFLEVLRRAEKGG